MVVSYLIFETYSLVLFTVYEPDVIFSGALDCHFAKRVIFEVTLSVAKSHAFVPAASLYQPRNVKPVRVGATGAVMVVL